MFWRVCFVVRLRCLNLKWYFCVGCSLCPRRGHHWLSAPYCPSAKSLYTGKDYFNQYNACMIMLLFSFFFFFFFFFFYMPIITTLFVVEKRKRWFFVSVWTSLENLWHLSLIMPNTALKKVTFKVLNLRVAVGLLARIVGKHCAVLHSADLL